MPQKIVLTFIKEYVMHFLKVWLVNEQLIKCTQRIISKALPLFKAKFSIFIMFCFVDFNSCSFNTFNESHAAHPLVTFLDGAKIQKLSRSILFVTLYVKNGLLESWYLQSPKVAKIVYFGDKHCLKFLNWEKLYNRQKSFKLTKSTF